MISSSEAKSTLPATDGKVKREVPEIIKTVTNGIIVVATNLLSMPLSESKIAEAFSFELQKHILDGLEKIFYSHIKASFKLFLKDNPETIDHISEFCKSFKLLLEERNKVEVLPAEISIILIQLQINLQHLYLFICELSFNFKLIKKVQDEGLKTSMPVTGGEAKIEMPEIVKTITSGIIEVSTNLLTTPLSEPKAAEALSFQLQKHILEGLKKIFYNHVKASFKFFLKGNPEITDHISGFCKSFRWLLEERNKKEVLPSEICGILIHLQINLQKLYLFIYELSFNFELIKKIQDEGLKTSIDDQLKDLTEDQIAKLKRPVKCYHQSITTRFFSNLGFFKSIDKNKYDNLREETMTVFIKELVLIKKFKMASDNGRGNLYKRIEAQLNSPNQFSMLKRKESLDDAVRFKR